MSTIASPRPSISSRRTSASTDTSTNINHQPQVDRGSLRRNRAALRDYYGLKHAAPESARDTPPPTPNLDTEEASELDRPNFDAKLYVDNLLKKESLDGVLRVEAGLLGEIKSLDGEKKALVYDNYSKLIAATDTIKNMRERMDPLTPTTATLTPAIGHIAETAEGLSSEMKRVHAGRNGAAIDAAGERRAQQETVRWVLGAPKRLARLMEQERQAEAQNEWREVSGLLDKWHGVGGVDDVRKACLDAVKPGGG